MNQNSNIEKDIFAEALELPPDQREGFLKGACRSDDQLRQRVEDLLRVHGDATRILKTEDKLPTMLDAPIIEGAGTVIGRYKLLEKIGEGGFGAVYVAEQREPVKRRVALKIIKLGMDTRQVVARFEAERQALALMDHPNIAKVLDAGATDTGRPYFVMELVRGIPITQYCDENHLSAEERLRLFMLVCQAIQHAHQKGIIHRDIKPSNILITVNDGVPVPKVIDFGIAKATQGVLTDKTIYTQFQQFIGTPAYMSPEQADMTSLDIDTRSDIYALGVLLYELLVGKTPFDGKELLMSGLDEMRRTIREKEPIRPSTRLDSLIGDERTTTAKRRGAEMTKLTAMLRGDLDWIVMKCLEKDRARRYETANGLAMDLRRYMENEPVTARPPTAAYKLQKAWKRNKIAYTAAAVVMVALVIGIGVSMWQTRRAWRAERDQVHLREVAVKALEGEKEQRTQAEMERQRAERRELEASQRAYASDMNIAKKALDENNLGHAMEMLEKHVPKPGEKDLRGWEWRYLWSQTHSDASFTLCQESNEIHSLSVSSDGNLLTATVHGRGGLSLWSIPERRVVHRLAQDEQEVCAVISPIEPILAFTGIRFDASGQQQSSLRLWNFVTREMITEERPLDGECRKLAISRDGRNLVTVTGGNRATYQNNRGTITVWSLPEGTERHKYPLPKSPGGFAVTPDLGLAAVSMDGLRVLKLEDGRELWTNRVGADVLAFSPDGKWLAGDSNGQDILVWNAATGEEVGRLRGHESSVRALVFWPDGKKLASGSADQTIRIWDVPSQTCVDTLRGHRQQVWELALMPDHQTLVSGCRDGTVSLWDTSISHPRQRRIDVPGKAKTWAFDANSKSVVTFNGQGHITRYKGANFKNAEPLLETGPIHEGTEYLWCFSGDGRRFARGSPEGIVRVWDIPSRTLWRQIPNAHGQPRRMFAGGNRLLLLSLDDFIIHDLDLTTATEVQSWRAPAGILHFAISPDERYCVTLGYAGDAVITDFLKKITTKLNLDARESHDGHFSPDGRLLAVPNSLGFVRLWDTSTWNEVTTLRGFFGEVYGSVFLSKGSRLAAVAGNREAVRLYDTSTWLDTLTLEDGDGLLWPTIVSPDGNIIGATTFGGWDLRLWRAPSWEEIKETEAKEKAEIRLPPK